MEVKKKKDKFEEAKIKIVMKLRGMSRTAAESELKKMKLEKEKKATQGPKMVRAEDFFKEDAPGDLVSAEEFFADC